MTSNVTGPTSKPAPPDPQADLVVTQLLIVRDQQRSRDFYERVLGAGVVHEADPVVLQLSNIWLVLNVGGGPTKDKPHVIAAPPTPHSPLSSALNFRVRDVQTCYELWKSRGANFMTEPKYLGSEIRCYLTDPDGHYIEVGQSIG